MKVLLTMLSFVLSAGLSYAGPTVSGGVPPHPALTTMSLEKAQAGIDYPTERAPFFETVLALYEDKRIPLLNDVPALVPAEAGVEFPTDGPTPVWAEFQLVLAFSNGVRLPIRLSLQRGTWVWLLNASSAVEVSKIISIGMDRDRVEMKLTDGTIVEVK